MSGTQWIGVAVVLVAGAAAGEPQPPAARDVYGKGSPPDLSGTITPAQYWRLEGAMSCYRKDRAGAIAALVHLNAMDRQFVRYICSRNDISLAAASATESR